MYASTERIYCRESVLRASTTHQLTCSSSTVQLGRVAIVMKILADVATQQRRTGYQKKMYGLLLAFMFGYAGYDVVYASIGVPCPLGAFPNYWVCESKLNADSRGFPNPLCTKAPEVASELMPELVL